MPDTQNTLAVDHPPLTLPTQQASVAPSQVTVPSQTITVNGQQITLPERVVDLPPVSIPFGPRGVDKGQLALGGNTFDCAAGGPVGLPYVIFVAGVNAMHSVVFTNAIAFGTYVVVLKQPATGGTVSGISGDSRIDWPYVSGVKKDGFAALSTVNGTKDVFSFVALPEGSDFAFLPIGERKDLR